MSKRTSSARTRLAHVLEALEGRTHLSVAEPNNTLDQAVWLSWAAGQNAYADAVGSGDADDYFKLYTRNGPGVLQLALSGLSADADLYLFKNGVQVARSTSGGTAPEFITVDTEANAYYGVQVHSFNGTNNTNYNLVVTTDYAGNRPTGARDMGTLLGQSGDKFPDEAPIHDYLDGIDRDDFYRFRMEANGYFTGRVRNFGTLSARMEVGRDDNNNNALDPWEVIKTSAPDGTNANLTRTFLAAGGNYLARVVANVTSAGNYECRLVADYAGDSPAGARDMGVLNRGTRSYIDHVGAFGVNSYEDDADFYKVTLTGNAALTARVELVNGFAKPTFNVNLTLGRDTDNNGVLSGNEVIATAPDLGAYKELTRQLSPGTYLLKVDPAGTPYPSYKISVNADPDAVPGDPKAYANMTKARDAGTLGGEVFFRDGVGLNDVSDFFKFRMEAAGTFKANTVEEYSRDGDVFLQVIKDLNNNGRMENNEIVASGFFGPVYSTLSTTLAAGNYFLRVGGNGGQTSYQVRLLSDYAGATPGTARNVGPLSATAKVLKDYVEQPQPGGDAGDVYKFTLGSTKTVFATTTGVAGEDSLLQLIRDKNNNGVVDAGEVLATSNKPDSTTESITKLLGPGTYFVRLLGVNGGTNYTLKLRTN